MSNAPATGYIELLHRRGVLSFFLSQICTNFGDGLFAVVLVAAALAAGATPFELGVVSFCTILPRGILGPIGGVIADRAENRSILLAVEFLRTVSILSAPLVFAAFGSSPLVLSALGFLVSSLFSVGVPAAKTHIPNLVDPADLQLANGLIQAIVWPAFFVGAGLLTVGQKTIGIQPLFYVIGAIFAVSFLLLLAVPKGRRAEGKEPLTLGAFIRDLVAGYRELARHRALHARVVMYGLYTFAWRGVLQIGIPLLLMSYYGGGIEPYGVLMMTSGIGELVGNLVIGKLRLSRPVATAFLGEAVLGVATVGLVACFVLGFPIAGVFFFTFFVGASACLIDIPVITAIQRDLGQGVMGKAISYWFTIGSVGGALGTVTIGSALEWLPIASTLMVFGGVLVALSLLAFVWAWRFPAGGSEGTASGQAASGQAD